MIRASFVIAVLALVIPGSSCASLVKVRDSSIPKLLTPLTDAKFDDLVKQLSTFTGLNSLRTSQAYLQFRDAESAIRYPEAYATLVLQRPDKIRLLIEAPGIKTKIADMVSESNQFKVAIYYGEYKRFLRGTNDADYRQWREKLGEKGRSALASARPFHFTEALMMAPLRLGQPGLTYAIEEALIEEPDLRQGARREARILRSFYVISEIELASESQSSSRVVRRFWFDRTNAARFTRQQMFDRRGELATEVSYSDYKKLTADNPELWPSVILVARPHDGYAARFTFSDEKFELNPDLRTTSAFTLENKDGLPETDLDKPITK